MRIVGMWLGIVLRRQWRSLLVLALLVALAAGTVTAGLAGARRGASAPARLENMTRPATAVALPNQPGFDWRPIERLPDVLSVSTFVVDYVQSYEGLPGDVTFFPPANGTVLRSIEKPVVLAGRVFRAASPEAVVTPSFAATFHRGVGSTVVLELPTARELAVGQGLGPGGSLTGPRLRLRIVGVIRSPWFSDSADSEGSIIPSPYVVAHYRANTIGDTRAAESRDFVNALVRLRGGEADIPRFRQEMTRVTGRSDIDIWDLPAQYADAQRQITFESRCLLALAGAALVAALFLLGQTLARSAAAATGELQIMSAVGLTTWQAALCGAAGPAVAGLAGAVIAAGGEVVASRWFPIGTAALAEPAPGVSVDWVVIGPALIAVPVLVAAGAMLVTRAALRATARDAPARSSAVAGAVTRAGLAAPAVIGVRFVLEPGRGRSAVPVRPALAGAIIGVLGIVAAFTFSHAVTDSVKHPERFGQTFQLVAETGRNGHDVSPAPTLISALDKSSQVTGVNDARVAVATADQGRSSITFYEYAAGRKPMPVVVLHGTMPHAADQVVLAPRTLASLHARVGGRVWLAGNKGAGRFMTVSGSGLVPEGSHNSYADGGWMTSAGYQSLFSGFKYHEVMITMAPGDQSERAEVTLAARIEHSQPALQTLDFEPADPPEEVTELRQVTVLPVVLGIFLALLAAGAVGHALVTMTRRRATDIAILRTLGLTRPNCRLIFATQATVLAVTGLIFGIPAGLVAGRSIWRVVASYTPVQYVPPLALGVLLAVAPGAILLAGLLAAWPGHRAVHLQITQILHAE